MSRKENIKGIIFWGALTIILYFRSVPIKEFNLL